jgi:hypothetical protein
VLPLIFPRNFSEQLWQAARRVQAVDLTGRMQIM